MLALVSDDRPKTAVHFEYAPTEPFPSGLGWGEQIKMHHSY